MNKTEALAQISTAMQDVEMQFWPSPYQWRQWHAWIRPDLGCDPQGNLLGKCPLHTDDAETNATFNFSRGIMRCEAETSCHAPKRAISLNNVQVRMQEQ